MTAASLVTPVVLTFNEEANVGRVLNDLTWAASVVVVDSGSTDDTYAIARRFPNMRWIVRPFDRHANQWQFGVDAAETAYVLALDADYRVPAEFVREIDDAFLPTGHPGGVAGFDYYIQGRRLLGSVYPPKVVLFKRDAVEIGQSGHAQEVAVAGPTYRFRTRLGHDDRKPIDRFVRAQLDYARLEAARLSTPGRRRWQDWLRLAGLMPAISGPAAYVRAGGPLTGSAALRYACERTAFECLLAMELVRRHGRRETTTHAADESAQPQ